MIAVRAGKNALLMLQNHWRVAILAFVAGAGAWLTVGTLWPKQYIGSALVALNLSAIAHQSPPALDPGDRSLPAAMAAQLQQTVAQLDWAGIIGHYHPYSEIEADGGPAHAAARLASRLSIAPASDMGADVARITYTGSDRELVLGITNEVAGDFVKVARPALKALPEEPLYAPVILPDVLPPAPRTTRNRARREARSARRHQKEEATPVPATPPDAAELSAALQASRADGAKLQDALNASTSNLDHLKEQLN